MSAHTLVHRLRVGPPGIAGLMHNNALADEAADRIEALEAEVERLALDAARYAYSKTLEGQADYINTVRHKGADHLDAAYDAAMAARPEGSA